MGAQSWRETRDRLMSRFRLGRRQPSRRPSRPRQPRAKSSPQRRPTRQRAPPPRFAHETTVSCSAYNSVPGQTDATPFLAAWNNVLVPGEKAAAVSRDLLRPPYNPKNGDWVELLIDGRWQRWRIRDKMNARYTKTIDLWFGGPRHGSRSSPVWPATQHSR